MRGLLIFFSCVLGLASAAFYDALDQEAVILVSEFRVGMDQAPSLATVIPDIGEEAAEIEEDVKSQLALSLREVLRKTIEHAREALEQAKKDLNALMLKAAQLVEKLKAVSGIGGEILERLRDKVKDWLKIFLEKHTWSGQEYALIRIPLELDQKNLMENVKQNILERLNLKVLVDYVKARLHKLGEVGRVLLEALLRPGAFERLKDLIEGLLPGLRQNYSLSDVWSKITGFFKNVWEKISTKFFEFSKWIKTVSQNGWEKIKDKTAMLKELAKTVISKGGTMSKEAARQALEFFQNHKKEIGEVAWSLLKKALVAVIAQAG